MSPRIACVASIGLIVLVGYQLSVSVFFENNLLMQDNEVTFKDIAPIIYENCTSCHRPGQLAPFSLLTYQEVKSKATRIAELTSHRVMPPWPPEVGYGEFSNERRLSDEQINLIQKWVTQGAIEGNPIDLPMPPSWSDEWQLGSPDLIIENTQSYSLQEDGTDVFRNFVINVPISLARYIRGVEFRPGNRRLVHHAVIRLDSTGMSRELDEADPEVGYSGMLGDASVSPSGRFLGWTPGREPQMEEATMAWRLEPGTDFVVHLHLLPTGNPEPVEFQIGLFFTDRQPTLFPYLINLGTRTIEIPAGQKDYVVSDSYILPTDVEVLSVYPHAHYLGKDLQAFATLPDGTRESLIWIQDWDFNWQDVYLYKTPTMLPKGTTISMEYTYDNSAENTRNPNEPPRHVSYGPHSSDEMAELWLQVIPSDPAGIVALERDHWQRQLNYVIADAEVAVRTNPRDAEKQNFLGARYVEAGRIKEAIPYLEEAIKIRDDYADAHSNLGSALQAEGRLIDAVEHFRLAVSLNPQLADARNNLGVALAMQGELEEAIQELRLAVELDPGNSGNHANLGAALRLQGNFDEAISSLRSALEIDSGNEGAQNLLNQLEQLRE
jgi:tetratricopeptide (TPR) repeat protein